MSYNKFSISIVVRIILITLNCFAIAILYTEEERIFTLILFALVLIVQAWLMYRYVGKSNRDFARFLLYMEEKDTSIRLSEKYSDKYFEEIGKRYANIIEYFKQLKIEKEQKERFLNILIEHIDIGVIAVEKNGSIMFVNKSALDLIQIEALININHLKNNHQKLHSKITNLKAGESVVFKQPSENEIKALSITKTIIKQEQEISLISIQDIKAELEENELESYQKLIRVITHEMMNSLTPITTLTSTIKRNLKTLDANENISDSILSSELIEDRSKGLIDFIQKYRQFTNLPKPVLKPTNINKLLQSVSEIIKHDNTEIEIEVSVKDDLEITFDQHLVEQLLINLLKNAIEAFSKKGRIWTSATENEIQVRDNAGGIEEEVIDQIFVPFFTTKENGSGIGLSLCKQIMHLHKGKILVETKKGEGTTFTLKF